MTEDAQISLVLPDRFDAKAATELREQLQTHLNIGQPEYFFTKSIDPERVIQLIGSASYGCH